MKYLTKEWIGNYERMIFAESVKSNGNMEGLTELAYKRMYKKYKTDFINEFRKDPRFEDGSLVWSDEYAKENFNAHMEIREKVFDSFPEEVKSYLNNKDCKYTYRIDNNSLFKEIDMPKDLPIYIENENGKTAILKSNW